MKSRKILASLLIIAIMICLMPMKTFAANTLKLTITPSVTQAHPGDEVTYTVKMSAVQDLYGFMFNLVIPEGLTFVEGKEADGLQNTLNAAKATFESETKALIVGSSNYSSTTDTTLMTFKCSVDSDCNGDKEIAFIIDEDNIFNTSYDNIPVDYKNNGSKITVTPRPIPATEIKLDKNNISLEKGANQKLTATVSPNNTTDSITWKSSDETKAKVDNNGNVTAVAEGNAIITVETTSGKKATCAITITKPVCKHVNKSTVPAKEPTCTLKGNNEYKVCDDCGKLFKTNGTTVTTLEAETIKALGHDFTISKQDEKQHWKECSRCGIADQKVDHAGEGEYQKDTTNHWRICGCGVKVEEESHIAGEPVKENRKPATCTEEGSYDEVVYCKVCGEKLSTTSKTEPATGHTAGEPVKENIKEPTCTEDGSHEEVVYCSVCKVELSRTEKVDKATGHTAGETVKENVKEATCTEDGSHEDVVYCSVCKAELSRTEKVDKAGHKEAEPVNENVKEATCTEDGKHEEVVYCSVCKEELSRTEKVDKATGHKEAEPVKENEIAATVDKEGSYDEVVYCSECKKELSRTKKTTPKVVYEATENNTNEIDKKTQEKSVKKNSSNPNTGDSSNIALWIAGLAISGILFVIVLECKVTRKKGRH